MPIYEFKCEKCNAYDERLMPLSHRNDRQFCAICKSEIRRLISVPTILGTDTQLFLSRSDDGFGNDHESRKIAKAKADAAGVVTSGKTFVPGLCRRGVPFDPMAWVSDKSEVVKKAEKLGRNVVGSIQHKTPIRDEHIANLEKPYRVSRDAVKEEVAEAIEQRHGGTATAAQTDSLFEEMVDKHSGN